MSVPLSGANKGAIKSGVKQLGKRGIEERGLTGAIKAGVKAGVKQIGKRDLAWLLLEDLE
jgi:hypothetical protein